VLTTFGRFPRSKTSSFVEEEEVEDVAAKVRS
jgi:hypothetical protein